MSLGTWLYTKLYGDKVGEDAYGNVYYQAKTRKRWGDKNQRWVIYNGEPEASKVPPEWHAWLHHTTDKPIEPSAKKVWVKPHIPNLTGTDAAYFPPGHDSQGGRREKATGDYQAWSPDS